MARGVVWTGPVKRIAVASVSAALLLGPLATAASAITLGAPKPLTPKVNELLDQWGDSTIDHLAVDLTGKYQPTLDPGSLSTVTQGIGARAVWGQHDAAGNAVTGQGVTVAVLDSGVEPVAGLNGAGKVVEGPDLSLEANSASDQGHDTYGHGTFMAGIIAAEDPVTLDKSGKPTGMSASTQLGVAPGAKVLAVKAATADGSTDVSEVIAGLDWIVEHRNDNGMNVRVVNLSFGTDSLQPYQVDPLAEAAENAWRHGIVVVASAGNEGNNSGGLTDPAMDPYVLAVGATDPGLVVTGWLTPVVASFSNSGDARRSPDVVAPGKSIVSLRDPGSYIDANHPEGMVLGDTSKRLFRGSGTSQAAAVTSGGVALLAQAFPQATPDQLKAALTATAKKLFLTSSTLQGAGQISLNDAYNYLKALFPAKPTATTTAKLAALTQKYTPSNGLGSLDAARGGSYLTDPVSGSVLSGEVDVQGYPWNAQAWTRAEAGDTAWDGGNWLGVQYSGNSWVSNTQWSGARWSGARWSGARWSDADWDGARWSGARWSGARWSSARWSSARWSSNAWE
jgi:serine protease AprX